MQNFGMSILWFWTSYFIVTLIGVGHTFFNIAVLHMKSIKDGPSMLDALMTGMIWTIICIVFDAFGWVIIKHPWSLSFKEFYIDYQPWI